MNDYDSDDDIEDYHLDILDNLKYSNNSNDSNKSNDREQILESAKFLLYLENKNKETEIYVRDFIVSKIKDINCREAGKFALIYYRDTKEEWIKNLMDEQSKEDNPASSSALQFMLEYNDDQVVNEHKDAYKLFEKYLNSDDEYVQYDTIKFLFKISNPISEIKPILFKILTDVRCRYRTEIAMSCFPSDLSLFACNKFHSSKLLSFFFSLFLLSIILLPITILLLPFIIPIIRMYFHRRAIFFICVQILNSALIDGNFSVAKYLLCLKSKHLFPETLHMINYEKAYEIVKNTFENGTKKQKEEAYACIVDSGNRWMISNDDYSDFNRVYLRRVRNLERFNLDEIQSEICKIKVPDLDLKEEIERLFELDCIKNCQIEENFYDRKENVISSLNKLAEFEIIFLKHILFFINKNEQIFSDFKTLTSILMQNRRKNEELRKLAIDAFRSIVPLDLNAKQLIARVVILPFVINFSDLKESIKYNRKLYMYEDFLSVKDLIKEFRKNYIPIHKIIDWLQENKLELLGIHDHMISDYGILNLLIKMEFLHENERNNRLLEKLRRKDVVKF